MLLWTSLDDGEHVHYALLAVHTEKGNRIQKNSANIKDIHDRRRHYSLLVGMDIPNDKITVANPYGYVEELSVDEFLQRTSFEAYENMPFYFKLAFAVGMFEKNTIFTVHGLNEN